MSKHNVIVYGTLRAGHGNHNHFLAGATPLGTGVVKGFAMFSLHAFPFVTEKQDDTIVAEAYQVSDTELEGLDYLEGYPNFYDRKKVELQKDDGVVEGWMYYMKDNARNAPYVVGGDWNAR